MSGWGDCESEKFPVGEMLGWETVWSESSPVGKLPGEWNALQGSLHKGTVWSGNCPDTVLLKKIALSIKVQRPTLALKQGICYIISIT